MISKFLSLGASEVFIRGSKFLFFISMANFYNENIIYEYGFFTAIFSIVFVLSDLGYQTYIFKKLSSKNSLTEYIKYSKLAIFRLILFVFVSSFILIWFLFSNKILYFYIFIIFLSDAILSINFSFYRAKQNSKKETIIKFIIGTIFLLVSILAILKINSETLFIILALIYLSFAIYSSPYLKNKIIILFLKDFKIKNYYLMSKGSLYIFLGALFSIAYLRIDILMLNILSQEVNVSLYIIASRVLELAIIAPTIIGIIILPKLINNKHTNIKKDIFIQFLIGLIMMILFMSISPIIINIFFNKFNDSLNIINILSLGIPFILINGYIFTYLIAKNISIYYAYITFIMLALNIALNYIYIRKYGYEAAAYTTIATELLGTMLSLALLSILEKRNIKSK